MMDLDQGHADLIATIRDGAATDADRLALEALRELQGENGLAATQVLVFQLLRAHYARTDRNG